MHARLLLFLVIAMSASFTGTVFAAPGAKDFLKQPESWFASAEAAQAAANILRNQTEHGGWSKNFDTTSDADTAPLDAQGKTSFDNGATLNELRFLSRIFEATGDPAYRAGFEWGFGTILAAQYPTGGWPQIFPPPPATYHRHITFNDGAMVNIMHFLRGVVRGEIGGFLSPEQRAEAQAAFDRGIECILACQIEARGKLTAWCAQHDEVDLAPRMARRYELPSLSGAESVGIVKLLMTVDPQTPETRRAIEAAVAWFEEAKITGHRIVEHALAEEKLVPAIIGPGEPGGAEVLGPDAAAGEAATVVPHSAEPARSAVADAEAPAIWARMYDLETNEPLVSHMDSVPRLGLGEIGHGRRGYQWFGRWPERLLARDYPRWKAKQPAGL